MPMTAKPGLTVAQRQELGRERRKAVPRSSHADHCPPAGRPDPVDLLLAQARTRVPELVPIRHRRMLASPFAFFRGGAAMMAADLAGPPTTDLPVQACGDAHLGNFGLYGSRERSLVFDINDFDETLPGPWEWDVKRLAASFEIHGRSRGFPKQARQQAVRAAVRGYRDAMAMFAAEGNLEVWYHVMNVDLLIASQGGGLHREALQHLRGLARQARRKDSTSAMAKLTEVVDGHRRITEEPPLVTRLASLAAEAPYEAETLLVAQQILATYAATLPADARVLVEGYTILDIARKVVGVGSVGTRCWIALLVGRDEADPLMLQVKEAQPSALEAYLGGSAFEHAGQRVVAGQKIMQATSDLFLGWTSGTDITGVRREFYVRQLRDWKASADLERMDARTAEVYGRACGWALAKGHARSGDRVAIAAYLGSGRAFAEAMVAFAQQYADQNERDYAQMQEAAAQGRITVAERDS
jgi:uncharacterized protein (DUF2252 family)